MPASRAASESKNSLLYALVIFIVLFLAAAVFAVMFFVKIEKFDKEAAQATEELNAIATASELREIKPLAQPGGASAIRQITADMRHIAGLIAGDELTSMPLVGIRTELDKRVNPLLEKLEQLRQVDPMLGPVDSTAGLVTIGESLVSSREYWAGLYADAEKDLESLTTLHEQENKTLKATNADLTAQLQNSSQAAQKYQQDTGSLLDQLREKYEQEIQDYQNREQQAKTDKTTAEAKLKELDSEMAKSRSEIKNLKDRLQKFQASPEQEIAALEPDGYIVEVVPRDKIAYINLAQNDHIYRGLTFSVYDRFNEIPRSGAGKGSLEVIEIMDTISKCRIVDQDTTNPIMEKDIIASLIWNRDKEYRFCVVGDFDFNSDGQIDPDGRKRIEQLISQWGGLVSDKLSVETDFLVLGSAPAQPEQPVETFMESNAEKTAAYQRALEEYNAYQQVVENGKALGVPTFNLTRFLYFIGYYQQAKTIR